MTRHKDFTNSSLQNKLSHACIPFVELACLSYPKFVGKELWLLSNQQFSSFTNQREWKQPKTDWFLWYVRKWKPTTDIHNVTNTLIGIVMSQPPQINFYVVGAEVLCLWCGTQHFIQLEVDELYKHNPIELGHLHRSYFQCRRCCPLG